MGNKVIVVGSSNTDMVITSPRIPAPGETILGGKFLMNPGGKGANQAVAAARLGGNVLFIARVGNDSLGAQAIELYRAEGVDCSYITVDEKQPSGVALIMVDAKGENCISVAASANDTLMPSHIDAAVDRFDAGDIVMMQLETPLETVCHTAELASRMGLKVILNPAPARDLPDSLLRNLYMIVPNETEAEMLSGVKVYDAESARRAAEIIASKGVEIVLITMGRQGTFMFCGDKAEIIPSYPVKAVDTTAAGDTFCGALCVALSEGIDLERAVRFGNRAASISVTRPGAQASVPCRAELNDLD